MSSGKKVVVVAFVLMQALLLTQVDFSLAIVPANSSDMATHYNANVPSTFLQYHAGKHAAYVYAIPALAPYMAASSLFFVNTSRSSTGQAHGQLFATLINDISKAVLIFETSLFAGRVSQEKNIWAYIKEAIGPPPSLVRPIVAWERHPNC